MSVEITTPLSPGGLKVTVTKGIPEDDWEYSAFRKTLEKCKGNQVAHLIMQELERMFYIKTFPDTEKRHFYSYENGIYVLRSDDQIRGYAQKDLGLGELMDNRTTSEVLGYLRGETCRSRKGNDYDPKHLICLRSHILNLYDLDSKPRAQTPDFIFFGKINANYNPQTTCPEIENYLKQVVQLYDLPLVQEMVGFLLLKQYLFHKLFILWGPNDTGKGTFINLLETFLGKEGRSAESPQNLVGRRFNLLRLEGKFANLYPDLGATPLQNTDTIRAIIGDNSISGEHKYSQIKDFNSYAKQIWAGNQIPHNYNEVPPFYTKLIMIPFLNKFGGTGKDDTALIKKLTTPKELSGFLNYAIEGLKRLQTQGGFTQTPSTNITRERYIQIGQELERYPTHTAISKPLNHLTQTSIAIHPAILSWLKQRTQPTGKAYKKDFREDFQKHNPGQIKDGEFDKKIAAYFKQQGIKHGKESQEPRRNYWVGISLKTGDS